MGILISELQYRLSGGASNINPNLSIGGDLSNFQVSDTIMNSMYDDISTSQALAGMTDYRCFYIYNANTVSPLNGANIWMKLLPGGDATMTIGLDPGGLNTTPAVLANENTAPAGVTFTSSIDETTALFLGNIPALGRYPFWVKRVQAANATPPAVSPLFSVVVKGLLNT